MVMTLVRVTLVLGGTAAYVGLAILGWGGWPAFFSHPARGALAVALAVLAGISLCADGNLRPGLREDRGNRWVIGALALLGLLAASLPAYTDRKAFWGFLPNRSHTVRRMRGVKPRPPFVIPLQLGSLTPILGQQPHQPSDLRVTHAKHSPPDP
jgi:hypothetical protein